MREERRERGNNRVYAQYSLFWDWQNKQIAKKVTGKIKNNQEKVKKVLTGKI